MLIKYLVLLISKRFYDVIHPFALLVYFCTCEFLGLIC
jgi:hypothetical protein